MDLYHIVQAYGYYLFFELVLVERNVLAHHSINIISLYKPKKKRIHTGSPCVILYP